ncbi:MAG: hypothetical protein D8M56_17540 [Chloroflexi bacterium]|nr:hypothetical protein [Chloroflexota bacterium]
MIKTKKTTKIKIPAHVPVLVVSDAPVRVMRKKMISQRIGPVHQEGVHPLGVETDLRVVARRLAETGMPIVAAPAVIGPEPRHKTRAAQALLARHAMLKEVVAPLVAAHLVGVVARHSTGIVIRMKKMRAAQVAVLAVVARRLAETVTPIVVAAQVAVPPLVETVMPTAVEAVVLAVV